MVWKHQKFCLCALRLAETLPSLGFHQMCGYKKHICCIFHLRISPLWRLLRRKTGELVLPIQNGLQRPAQKLLGWSLVICSSESPVWTQSPPFSSSASSPLTVMFSLSHLRGPLAAKTSSVINVSPGAPVGGQNDAAWTPFIHGDHRGDCEHRAEGRSVLCFAYWIMPSFYSLFFFHPCANVRPVLITRQQLLPISTSQTRHAANFLCCSIQKENSRGSRFPWQERSAYLFTSSTFKRQ